jgi:YD repeat-containing protein
MKLLSETLTKHGIAFSFPIRIEDSNGNETYFENRDGCWSRRDYDANGNQTYYECGDGYWIKGEYDTNGKETYYEDSRGYWIKCEYDSKGNVTYREDSDGKKKGAPKSSKTCNGKVIEVDGKKYKLIEL